MVMNVSYQITQQGVLFDPNKVEEETRHILKGAIQFMLLYAQGEVMQLVPVGVTSNARNSIKVNQPDDLSGSVGSDLDYIDVLESGSAPHFPGLQGFEALKLWVQRKDYYPQKAKPDMTLEQRTMSLMWAIKKYGTSRNAQNQGGHSGPTGGFGYWMFETVEAKMDEGILDAQLAQIGLELTKVL